MLLTRGYADNRVPPVEDAGFFDRLPRGTPKAGFFGLFDHELPEEHSVSGTPELERADFGLTVIAWFDRWLKGNRTTGVDSWPEAQVQGGDGQWRAENNWPARGPAGQIALNADGVLGGQRPTGSSSFREGLVETSSTLPPKENRLIWETAPVKRRLELTGTPVANLWLTTSTTDGHLAARLEALDRDGKTSRFGSTLGLRSLRHLAPMEHGYFQQTFQRPVSPGQVLNVPLRFQPTDLVVPRGGQLRLTLAGSLIVNDGVGELAEFFGGAGGADTIIGGPSQPSLAFSQIQILHDCAHTSALRFHLAERRPHLLNVREPDEAADEPLKSRPSAGIVASSGGLARANICGRPPRGPDRLLK